jgi:hypothetical protein
LLSIPIGAGNIVAQMRYQRANIIWQRRADGIVVDDLTDLS